ncbi:TonB-dependent receptor [Aurantiacibacter atlanticus]|uniref:TonB-dependent receptor n=1 Tax=Aurantiacibacter atlanticus TaxID=1648404 RepID=A0A0H4V9M4_9SPHN|nr:TonB-dependent receptor [Aurantiacibacter atlanticus]AKQ41312.1 TonB-dependent receptor [Aurantiacibacter atlanticus]
MVFSKSLLAGASALALAVPTAVIAGTISGTVIDASETVALRAAQVRIVELDRTAGTERDGSFYFVDVPAGSYTIEVRYIGAPTTTQTVTVSETGLANAVIQVGSQGSASEILVIGQAASLASSLSRKRDADGVSDVLTRDAIGQFPDQNVAESLRRLPGVNVLNDQGEGRFVSVRGLSPNLNATSLNGVRLPSPESDTRGVALDVISSDIIESIDVKKSLTPDMDGDTIGASIEIETTSAFDRRKDLLTIKAEGSYNELADAVSPKGSVDFSTRVTDNFGVSGGLSYYNREFETDNVEADDWKQDGDLVYAEEFQYRDYDVERERISATLGLDFRAGESTELYVRGIYSQFDDQEFRRRLTFDLGDAGVSGSTEALVFSDDEAITVERDIKDRFESQKIRSLTFGGESAWGGWFADYSASWAKSTERENGSVDPTQFEREFEQEGLQLGFDVSDARVPLYSVLSDPGDFFTPSAYELNDVEFVALSSAQDEEFSVQLDVGHEFLSDAGTFTVQGGFKGRWREKSFDATVEFYETDDYTLADALGMRQTYSLDDISPLPGYTEATDFFHANFDQFELQEIDSQFDSAVSDFSVDEDILAGYLLGRWESSDLRVIAGVRYENTSNVLRGNDVLLVEEDGVLPGGGMAADDTVIVIPIAIDKDYDHWLPSVNLRYEAAPDVILRAAAYRSIVRPGPFQQAPRIAVEEADDGEREGEFGNPDLRPAEAWNFDAAAEYYLSSNGAVFASFFYKSLDDFIYEQNSDAGGVFRGVAFDEATILSNGQDGEIFGIELGYAHTLEGALDGIVLQANYTFTDSSGEVATIASDGPRSISLPTTSRHTANFSVGYDKGPIDVRLSGTYRDKYLDELSDVEELDRYVDDHFQLDLSAKYRVTEGIQLFYEWVNINNAKYFAYNELGGRRNIYQFEEYNWTMKFGARVTF